MFSNPLAMIGMPQGFEWIFIAAIGLLIFGKRLPDVGRSLGKSIVEFKKGLKGVGDELDDDPDHPKLADKSSRPAIAGPAIAGPAKSDPYAAKPLDVPASDQVEG